MKDVDGDGNSRRLWMETCRWQGNVETSWRHMGIVKMISRSELSHRVSGEARLERVRGLPTRQGSEHAERFTQSTDRVKDELTGESVHVDESAVTVRVICRLSTVYSLSPASCVSLSSVLRELKKGREREE